MERTIRTMTEDEVSMVLGWAAEEGWNPGLDDASAFHAADPQGYLIACLGQDPVAAVSVVQHAPDFGFLGLYLCRPEYRGQGHGIAVWNAGLSRLGNAVVGLDGVPAQQENYRKSGFEASHRTVRHEGRLPAPSRADAGSIPVTDAHLTAIAALDLRACGVARPRFLSTWLAPTQTRRSRVILRDGTVVAAATMRKCGLGYKLGPILAQTPTQAETLIADLASELGAQHIFLDVPDLHPAGMVFAAALGLEPVFECARMHKGPAPERDISVVFGEATLELG